MTPGAHRSGTEGDHARVPSEGNDLWESPLLVTSDHPHLLQIDGLQVFLFKTSPSPHPGVEFQQIHS